LAEPYALPNETWSTIAAGHTWTRGTDTTVELTDGALFDVGGGRIRFGVAPQFGVVTSFALMNYTSRTGNVLSGMTVCTMGAVVSPGDETKVWPAGTVVERVVTGEDVASRIMGPASATSGHFFKADGTTGKLAKAEAIADAEIPATIGRIERTTRTIYVNADSGSDTTGDGAVGTPYQTYSKALSTVQSIIADGVTITIHLVAATATYTPATTGRICIGTGNLVVEGELVSQHTGTAHASAATTLVDTGEFAAHACVGWLVYSAAGGGQYRVIRTKDNDGVTATVGRWATTPNGDAYTLYSWGSKIDLSAASWEIAQGYVTLRDLCSTAASYTLGKITGPSVKLTMTRCSVIAAGTGGRLYSVMSLSAYVLCDTCSYDGASVGNYSLVTFSSAGGVFYNYRTWIRGCTLYSTALGGSGSAWYVAYGTYIDGGTRCLAAQVHSYGELYSPTVNGAADKATLTNGSAYGLACETGSGAVYTHADYVNYVTNGTDRYAGAATYSWYIDGGV